MGGRCAVPYGFETWTANLQVLGRGACQILLCAPCPNPPMPDTVRFLGVWQLIKAGRQADASLQQKPTRTGKTASDDRLVFVQKALSIRVRKQEWSYGCDRCTI